MLKGAADKSHRTLFKFAKEFEVYFCIPIILSSLKKVLSAPILPVFTQANDNEEHFLTNLFPYTIFIV